MLRPCRLTARRCSTPCGNGSRARPHGIAHAHLEGAGRRRRLPGRSRSANAATPSRSGRPTAATSASSRHAARHRRRSARAQIYMMRADGGEAWKLTDAKEAVTSYSWSPDRRASPTSRSIRDRATKKPPSASETTSACSKATSATRTCGRSTSRPKAATRDHERDVVYGVLGAPSWSPDSKRLAFGAQADDDDPRSSFGRLHRRCDQWTSIEKISTNPGADGSRQWSPDGRFIAWSAGPE